MLRSLIEKVKKYCRRFPSVLTRTCCIFGYHMLSATIGKLTIYSAYYIIYFHFGDSTCTARAYKYDENEEEFFVETEETVRIRKSDLETFQGVEETGSMPSSIKEVRALSLMETPQPKAGQGQPALPGPPPPNSKTDAVEAKSNLEKFLESLHKKASQATGWVSSLEPPSTPSPTPKQKAFLDLWLFLYTLIFIDNVLHTVINPKCNSHSYYNIIIWIYFEPPRFCNEVGKIMESLEGSFLKLAECQHILDSNGKTEEYLGLNVLQHNNKN